MTIATIETSPLPDRMQYAKALAGASIIPKAYQRQPADVLVAIEYGTALGIAPIVALSEINVIQGTPSLSASLMVALAREAGHKVRVTGDATSATCTIVRKDDPDFEHTATWDEKKARDAGLWGKGHWGKDPATMLRWRAMSECVRFACSEVLGGLRYTPEEVHEFKADEPQPVKLAPPKPKPNPEPADTGEVKMITEPQSKKLHVLMRDLSLGRDDMLAMASEETGRDISTSKDLTVAEASSLIDQLDKLPRDASVVEP